MKKNFLWIKKNIQNIFAISKFSDLLKRAKKTSADGIEER